MDNKCKERCYIKGEILNGVIKGPGRVASDILLALTPPIVRWKLFTALLTPLHSPSPVVTSWLILSHQSTSNPIYAMKKSNEESQGLLPREAENLRLNKSRHHGRRRFDLGLSPSFASLSIFLMLLSTIVVVTVDIAYRAQLLHDRAMRSQFSMRQAHLRSVTQRILTVSSSSHRCSTIRRTTGMVSTNPTPVEPWTIGWTWCSMGRLTISWVST